MTKGAALLSSESAKSSAEPAPRAAEGARKWQGELAAGRPGENRNPGRNNYPRSREGELDAVSNTHLLPERLNWAIREKSLKGQSRKKRHLKG